MIDPQNTASIRVAEKADMRYEKDVMLEGYTHPLCWRRPGRATDRFYGPFANTTSAASVTGPLILHYEGTDEAAHAAPDTNGPSNKNFRKI